MRKRDFNINVRVTESEKKYLNKFAKHFGLSLSEYLRKVGLDKKLKEKPSIKLYEAYSTVNDLLRDFTSFDLRYIEMKLKEIEQKILSAYHETEDSDNVGYD